MTRIVLAVAASFTILAGSAAPAIAAETECVELMGWSTCMPRP